MLLNVYISCDLVSSYFPSFRIS